MFEGEKQPTVLHFGLHKQDDKPLLKKLSKILAKPGVVWVGQNHESFDMPWINGRLAYHSLPQLPPLQYLDTLKMARSALNLNCYKLDYMLKFFGHPGKIDMNIVDWIGIMEFKDPVAFAKMLKYNKKDVKDTQWLFKKLLPYTDLKIHLGVLIGSTRESCPQCGSMHKWADSAYKVNKSGLTYRRYECQNCGRKWFDRMTEAARLKQEGKK